jgi:hypothetical protein
MNSQLQAHRTCLIESPVPGKLKAQLLQKYNFTNMETFNALLECPAKCHLICTNGLSMSKVVTHEAKHATQENIIWIVSDISERLGYRYDSNFNIKRNQPTTVFKSTVILIRGDIAGVLRLLCQPGHRSLHEILTSTSSSCDTNHFLDPELTFFGFN